MSGHCTTASRATSPQWLAASRGGQPVVVDVRIDSTIRIPKRERFAGFASKQKRVVN